jgi:hypothetical protein
LEREKVRRHICIIDKHLRSGGKTIAKSRRNYGREPEARMIRMIGSGAVAL